MSNNNNNIPKGPNTNIGTQEDRIPVAKTDNRVFLLSRDRFTEGVIFDNIGYTAKGFSFESDVETEKSSYVMTSLDALLACLNSLDIENFDNVCQVYVTSSMYDAITQQTYKFWLMKGCDSNGECIEDEVLDLWRQFSDFMKAHGDLFVFRNIANCYLKDSIVKNSRIYKKQEKFKKLNDTYARYCRTRMNAKHPETVKEEEDEFIPEVG